MKILADQAVKMKLEHLVECKEQFNMMLGSSLGKVPRNDRLNLFEFCFCPTHKPAPTFFLCRLSFVLDFLSYSSVTRFFSHKMVFLCFVFCVFVDVSVIWVDMIFISYLFTRD